LRSRPQPLQPLLLLLLQPLLPVHLCRHACRVLLVRRPVRVGVLLLLLLLPVVLHLTELLLVPRRPVLLLLLRGLLLRVGRWLLLLLVLLQLRRRPGLQLLVLLLLMALQGRRAGPALLPYTRARHARLRQQLVMLPLLLGWPVGQGLGSLLLLRLCRLARMLAMQLLHMVAGVCPGCMAA
jgi:hypothetical protein